ncbi:beta strand repeat-containing protein [Methanothrix soehngenii]|uniref:beta strand repeat-containing protein n=1 Tax=Methanothrix soehngenii TaxID=2223 RepID=UPI002B6C0483|nr:hypothetical protein [Methanothrix soehngenii]
MQAVASGITVGSPVTFDTTKSYALPNGDRVSAELDLENFAGTYNFYARYKPQTKPVQGLQSGVDISGAIADKTAVSIIAENIYSGRKAQTDIEILGSPGTVTGLTARAGHTTATAPYTANIYVPAGTAIGTDITVNGLAQESAGELSKVYLKLLNKGANLAYYDGTVTSTVAGGDTAITLDANGKGRIRDQITSQDGAAFDQMQGHSQANYVDANLDLDAWTAGANVQTQSQFNVFTTGPAKTIQGAVDGAMAGNANGHDTVVLQDSATYFENVVIPAKTLTILGQGLGTEVDGSGTGRVFEVQNGAVVDMDSFTIQNGFTTGSGGAIYNLGDLTLNGLIDVKNSHADDDGGAIRNIGGATLTINGAWIYDNDADDDGGAIYNTGDLVINDDPDRAANIYNNHADDDGGALVHWLGTTTINGGTIQSNTAGDNGGAIWVDWRDFVMNGGTIFNNVAANNGGGIEQTDGYTMTISGGSILANTANGGGGIHNGASGTVNFVGGTIDGNNAYIGGGVWNEGTFNMGGGAGTPVISNNHASFGGGVGNFLVGGGNPQFNMRSGVIENNVAANAGGGVYNGGTFIMSAPGSTAAPTIQGNSAHWGGGVYNSIVYGPALFTMWNGNILNNDAVADNALPPSGGMGGGIYNEGGSVTLVQGMVQGNEAFAGSAGTNAQKAGKGGGIYNEVVGGIGGTGTINLGDNAYVYMNTAHNSGSAGRGGGIYTDLLAATRIFGPWVNVNTNTPNNIWDALGPVT